MAATVLITHSCVNEMTQFKPSASLPVQIMLINAKLIRNLCSTLTFSKCDHSYTNYNHPKSISISCTILINSISSSRPSRSLSPICSSHIASNLSHPWLTILKAHNPPTTIPQKPNAQAAAPANTNINITPATPTQNPVNNNAPIIAIPNTDNVKMRNVIRAGREKTSAMNRYDFIIPR